MGKVINYLDIFWDTLIPSQDYFELIPDNNIEENAISPFCVGIKNWLFSLF